MKMHLWLCLLAISGMSAGVAAGQEQDTQPAPAPPPAPPAVTPAPSGSVTNTNAAPAQKRAARRKTAVSEPTQPVNPVTVGPAVARQSNINVRAKAAIKSEVLTRLKKGDPVEVLEIVQTKVKQDEPDKWARIPLPTNTAVWVHSLFVDPANNTVKPRRLNVRSGPSEDHSVIGRMERGVALREIERKGDWIKIEPPQGVYGFVAAHLLMPAVAPPVEVAKTEPPTTPPTETPVTPTPPPAPPTDVATTPPTPPDTTQPTPQPPSEEEIKRVVSREGIVKRSISIQAPTWFVLESPRTGKTVNYLHTPTNIVLRDFFGQRVIVTGEEGLDERWPNTPVINVESIEVVP